MIPPALARRASSQPLLILAVLLGVVAVLSASRGPVQMSPWKILGSLAHSLGLDVQSTLSARDETILWSIRLPRIALAGLAGAALATGGVVMQAVVRNPLADPAILGISNGAAVGAVAFLVLGEPLTHAMPTLSAWLLPICSFLAALAATIATLRLARIDGELSTTALLLGGVGLAALCGAATGVLVFLADDAQLRSITFWNLGSTGGASWPVVSAVAVPVAIALIILPSCAPAFDRLLLGEVEAHHLGVNVRRTVGVAAACAALAVGASVASCGVIGFVGLVVPHVLRGWLGPSHRRLLFASMLGGALLLIAADAVARTAVAPTELPVGVLTALVGAPVLLVLVRKKLSGRATLGAS
jgi:iron complex transport system permease protein